MPDAVIKEHYLLSRGDLETKRLNILYQHRIEVQGFYLHPEIVAKYKSWNQPLHVADLATGTGNHIIDLCDGVEELPVGSKFVGFDISPDQFPTNNVREDLSFHVQDVKATFPAELRGRFDVVNIALLFSAMEEQDWHLVAANAFDLLKPGGALQWAEIDMEVFGKVTATSIATTTEHFTKLVQAIMEPFQELRRLAADLDLAEVLTKAGFVKAQQTRLNTPRTERARELVFQNFMLMPQGNPMCCPALKGETLEEFLALAEKDVKSGAWNRHDLLLGIGWKPQC